MNACLAPSQPTVYDPRRWLALSVLLPAAVMYLLDISDACTHAHPGAPVGTPLRGRT
jgi:hypothetical protein